MAGLIATLTLLPPSSAKVTKAWSTVHPFPPCLLGVLLN